MHSKSFFVIIVFLVASTIFTIYKTFYPIIPLRDAVNSFPFLGIILAFATIPLSFLLVLAYGLSYLLAKQEEKLVGFVLAACFFSYAFLPIAGYMFEGALVNGESVGGFYMNALFPSGWLAIAFGLVFVFYNNIGLNKIVSLKKALIIAGVSIVLLGWLAGSLYGRDFIGLWHPGLEQYNIDVDSLSWGALSYAFPLLVFMVPFLSIFTGILLHFQRTN